MREIDIYKIMEQLTISTERFQEWQNEQQFTLLKGPSFNQDYSVKISFENEAMNQPSVVLLGS